MTENTNLPVVASGATASDQRAQSIETVRQFAQGGDALVFSTITGDDFESKKKSLNAMTNSEALADHLGTQFALANFIMQPTEVEDDQTGEKSFPIRTILIDADGNAYHAISGGLVTALKNIVGMLGSPAGWPAEGLPVQVVEERSRKGRRFMTIKLV